MISLARTTILAVLAATTFLEQDIPGVEVGRVNPWTGRASGNFRPADLDGDGAADVVLPREVAFQRDGAYARANAIALPADDIHTESECDIWGNQIFLRSPGRLAILTFEAGEWRHILRQDITWPDDGQAGRVPDVRQSDETGGLRFVRFLHDLDGDGTPELVVASPAGLHVLDRAAEFYEEVARLDIFPPMEFSHAPSQKLWPPAAREPGLPARRLTCRYWIEDGAVGLIVRTGLSDGRIRFAITRYALSAEAPFGLGEGSATTVTNPLPGFMEPCRLNEDGTMDFVGGRWDAGDALAFPAPVYETYVSTDGGAECRVFRSRAFRPLCSFVDFDGDGRLDLVTQRAGLFDGGPRETVSRFASQRRVEHEVAVRYQDAQAQFPDKPDVHARFTLRMDRPLVANTSMFKRYRSGDLVNLTGDFNGDGRRDALLQDRPGRLSLYLTTGEGIPARPSATLAIRDKWSFGVADIDGDARSDIVVRWADASGREDEPKSRVFLVRESGS
ncbi:MAG: VCBS repeat-containing protein [bacterium]|nr:VCBS repeat-containing protein [bacterium]